MTMGRPFILILAAITVAGTSPSRSPADRTPEPAANHATTDTHSPADSDTGTHKNKKQKHKLPRNMLTGAWHEGVSKPHNVRPQSVGSALAPGVRPVPKRVRLEGCRPQTAMIERAPSLPSPIQPHAPPTGP